VLKMVEQCNIRNYSIYLGELEEDKYYLFGYFEYVGDDLMPTWPRRLPTPPLRSGGTAACPARYPSTTAKRATGG